MKCDCDEELRLRDNTIKELRESWGLKIGVHNQALELIAKLQAENKKLREKGYEFQKLRDALHAKDVRIEKLEREIRKGR